MRTFLPDDLNKAGILRQTEGTEYALCDRRRVVAQQIGRELAHALHLERSTSLEAVFTVEVSPNCFGYLDRSGHASRFHPACDVDGVPPQIISEFAGADH